MAKKSKGRQAVKNRFTQKELDKLFAQELRKEKRSAKQKSKASNRLIPIKRAKKKKDGTKVFQEIFRDEKGKIITEGKYRELIQKEFGRFLSKEDYREILVRTFVDPEGRTVYEIARDLKKKKKTEKIENVSEYIDTNLIPPLLESRKNIYANDKKTSAAKMILEIGLGLSQMTEILSNHYNASVIEISSSILVEVPAKTQYDIYLYSDMRGMFYIEGQMALQVSFSLLNLENYKVVDTYGQQIE